MLAAAARLTSLHDAHLSKASRAEHKARVREAVGTSGRVRTRRVPWLLWRPTGRGWARGGAAALVGLALVGSVGLATAVAASVPGEWPYTVRVVIERVPASLYVDPASRAAAELDVSERRLADLKAQLASSGQADPQALAALMAGDRAAMQDAAGLAADRRSAVAARIVQHAQALDALSRAATSPQSVGSLESAALEAAEMSRVDVQAATAPTGSVEANGNFRAASPSNTGSGTVLPTATKEPGPPSGQGSAAMAPSTSQVDVAAPVLEPTAPPAAESSPVPSSWADRTGRGRSWGLLGPTPDAGLAPSWTAEATAGTGGSVRPQWGADATAGTGGAASPDPAAAATPAPPKATMPVPPASADPPAGTTRGDKGQHVPPPSHQNNPPPGRHPAHHR